MNSNHAQKVGVVIEQAKRAAIAIHPHPAHDAPLDEINRWKWTVDQYALGWLAGEFVRLQADYEFLKRRAL